MNWSSEKYLEKSFKREVERPEIGGQVLKLLSSVSGLPDRLVLLPSGRTLFIEFKSSGGRPRKLQSWWHRHLRDLGFEVLIICDRPSYDIAMKRVHDLQSIYISD